MKIPAGTYSMTVTMEVVVSVDHETTQDYLRDTVREAAKGIDSPFSDVVLEGVVPNVTYGTLVATKVIR